MPHPRALYALRALSWPADLLRVKSHYRLSFQLEVFAGGKLVSDGVHCRSTNGLAQLVARHGEEQGLQLMTHEQMQQQLAELVITVIDASSAASDKWPGSVIGESKVPIVRLWAKLAVGYWLLLLCAVVMASDVSWSLHCRTHLLSFVPLTGWQNGPGLVQNVRRARSQSCCKHFRRGALARAAAGRRSRPSDCGVGALPQWRRAMKICALFGAVSLQVERAASW